MTDKVEPVSVEPVAWLVTGGRIFADHVVLRKNTAEAGAAKRKDGSVVEPLVKLSQLEAEKQRAVNEALAVHTSDCPTFRTFWTKHALGSKTIQSCFACGEVGTPSIQHLELANIYVCEACVIAIRAMKGKP